jgi:hypothetical protein
MRMYGRSSSGWDLPPGAAGHPCAPWNEPDPEEECIAAFKLCYPDVEYGKTVCDEADLKINPECTLCPFRRDGYCEGYGVRKVVRRKSVVTTHPVWEKYLDEQLKAEREAEKAMADSILEDYDDD